MDLEEKKVLLSRKNVFKHWRDKEWWYTGIHDRVSKIYFSFFFARVNATDHFAFTLFDYGSKSEIILSFQKNLFLDHTQLKDSLDLGYHSKDLVIEYSGNEKAGWKFKFSNDKYNIDLALNPTTPYFTKYDNNFKNNYTLLHFFHNEVNGTIQTPEKSYTIAKALCYYDHCFGRVPRSSGWHWLAVQNEDTALASLINYGPYAQKYTQAYFKKNQENLMLNQWIRMSQEVSFECNPERKTNSKWHITSVDMDLTVTPIMHICNINKIPPLLPLLVNITHYEFFVKASGKMRVDDTWLEVENLYGVMEEHFGEW